MPDAPAPSPALVASAEGEPITDLDHARYDRDGWMESALRAQGYVGELQGRLAAALARAERLEEALRDCVIQIEYEHGKFGGTGSGETVLHRTRALLADEA